MSISSRPIKRMKKAPGPGKSPKVFSESLGISHLISLVDNISSRKDSEDDEKIQKSKEWEKKRKEAIRLKKLAQNPDSKEKDKKRRKGSKPEEFQLDSNGRPMVGSNSVKVKGAVEKGKDGTESVHSVKVNTKANSKADIRSKLKAQMRQKSKERKERRKAQSSSSSNSKSSNDQEAESGSKSTSSISDIVSRLKGKAKDSGGIQSGEDLESEKKTTSMTGMKRKRSDSNLKKKQEQSTVEPVSVLKSSVGKASRRGSGGEIQQEKGKGKAMKKKRVSFA